MTPRFYDYRGITARFASVATCGHPIAQGDDIGYTRRGRTSYTQCANCWARWVDENREADLHERPYVPEPF